MDLSAAGNMGTHSRKQEQVYCKDCKQIWMITKGTLFYHFKSPDSPVLEVLWLLVEGLGVRAVCRAKGITTEATGGWVVKAAAGINAVTIERERRTFVNVLPRSGCVQTVHHGKRTQEDADVFVGTIKRNSDSAASPLSL